MRTEYESTGIDVDQLQADPIFQFQSWLATAIQAELPEPNAMVLSTVDAQGQPWSRYVLLKHLDHEGFVFFTNYSSFKYQQLAVSPKASLTFGWLELRRQVTVVGSVEATSKAESESYWVQRPRGSQLGSWASRQSTEVASRSVVDQWYAQVSERFSGEDVPLPPHWGGWRLVPEVIEFWQGRENRLHDRIRYRRASEQLDDATERGLALEARQAPKWGRARLAP